LKLTVAHAIRPVTGQIPLVKGNVPGEIGRRCIMFVLRDPRYRIILRFGVRRPAEITVIVTAAIPASNVPPVKLIRINMPSSI
jgi:hypothetical protein